MSHCQITGSGTCAIYLALLASNIPQGAYIAVPNIACPDPVYALIWAGYKPYFIDVNLTDYNINAAQFEEAAMRKKVRGLIAIHLFGNPCAIDELRYICDRYGLFLLEDCAQALGNTYKGKCLGSFGDVSVYSFGNGKLVEVGHGGSVQTNDAAFMARIVSKYNKLPVFDARKEKILSQQYRALYYKIYNLALNFHLFDIFNLIFVYLYKGRCLSKFGEEFESEIVKRLELLDVDRMQRKRLIDGYLQRLDRRIAQPPILHEDFNVLSRLTVRIEDSEEVSALLRNSAIQANTMYPPLAGRFNLFYNKNRLSNSYGLRGKLLNIWTNPTSADDFEKTVNIIERKVV